MTITDIENSFQSILKPELGVTAFIPESDDGPQPSLPYATYHILSINHIGRVQREQLDEFENRDFHRHYEIIFRVTAYGTTAPDVIQNLDIALCKESITDSLNAANIPYSTNTPASLLPEVVKASWEKRSQMNVTCFYSEAVTETIPLINSVGIEQSISSDSGTERVITYDVP